MSIKNELTTNEWIFVRSIRTVFFSITVPISRNAPSIAAFKFRLLTFLLVWNYNRLNSCCSIFVLIRQAKGCTPQREQETQSFIVQHFETTFSLSLWEEKNYKIRKIYLQTYLYDLLLTIQIRVFYIISPFSPPIQLLL